MFMTVSHWSLDQITDDMMARADEKFMPMIMDIGASHAFMVQTGEDSMMVVLHFPDAATGQAAMPHITSIREMAASEFGMTMQSAAAGPVRAHR